MRYVSLFLGIGGFELGIIKKIPSAECLGYSEIDKYALKCYHHHFPTHKNLGDINYINFENIPYFELLVAGSPCQDLSIAKKGREGLNGERSKLFFKWLEILKAKKPRYFILENVASMSKENKALITLYIKEIYPDVQCNMINAALVSAQSRKRLFWTNFTVPQPEDRKIFLRDILEPEVDKKYFLSQKSIDKIKFLKGKKDMIRNKEGFEYHFKEGEMPVVQDGQAKPLPVLSSSQSVSRTTTYVGCIDNNSVANRIYGTEGKSVSIASNAGGLGAKTGLYQISGSALRTREFNDGELVKNFEERKDGKCNALTSVQTDSMVGIRRLTPKECERLQFFPDDFTSMLSDTQRYKCLGNAVNTEVVAHIVRCIPCLS